MINTRQKMKNTELVSLPPLHDVSKDRIFEALSTLRQAGLINWESRNTGTLTFVRDEQGDGREQKHYLRVLFSPQAAAESYRENVTDSKDESFSSTERSACDIQLNDNQAQKWDQEISTGITDRSQTTQKVHA